MNLVIVGPSGVGKSAVCKAIANQRNSIPLDFDQLGLTDMEKQKGHISPFSVTGLNLMQSLSPMLSTISKEFVLDIPCATIFRANVNNEDRLTQVFGFKITYSAKIVVLAATKDVLRSRFVSAKNRIKNPIIETDFNETWENWVDISQPYCQRCGDIFIDTSFRAVEDVVRQIEIRLNWSKI
jgi:hypothetical protein